MIKANQAEIARSEIVPGAVLTSVVLKGAEIWMNAQGEVLSVHGIRDGRLDTAPTRGDGHLVAVSPKDVGVSRPCRFRSDPARLATRRHSAGDFRHTRAGWRYRDFDKEDDGRV
jgi:hypothetical protein